MYESFKRTCNMHPIREQASRSSGLHKHRWPWLRRGRVKSACNMHSSSLFPSLLVFLPLGTFRHRYPSEYATSLLKPV